MPPVVLFNNVLNRYAEMKLATTAAIEMLLILRALQIGDDRDEHEDRFQALAKEDQISGQKRCPARTAVRIFERLDVVVDHRLELFGFLFDRVYALAVFHALLDFVELILSQARLLGGDRAAHDALQTLFFINAVVRCIDEVACTLVVARLVDRNGLVDHLSNTISDLLPLRRRICARHGKEHEHHAKE